MAHNPLTSTLIDDCDLLDQLRLYGETNLPLLPGQAGPNTKSTRSKKSAKGYLNDSNREIYLKKLNHYKAREKVETNPSKHHLKTRVSGSDGKSIDIKRISNIYKIEDDIDEDDVQEIDNKDDIIELDKTEYVQVVNGCTSPLSMSDYDPNSSNRFNDEDDYAPSILSSTRAPSIGQGYQARSPSSLVKHPDEQKVQYGYVKLKDRIELDETLSKYRMDIENILHNSVRRNRLTEGSAAQRYLNDDVLNDYKKSPNKQKISYCPIKPEPTIPKENNSIFGSLKSKIFNTAPVENKTASNIYEGLRKREGINKNEQPNLPMPSKAPKESFSLFSFIGSFISYAGLQMAKFLPYLVVILLTVIALQYVHLKFNSNPEFNESPIDDGKVLVDKIFDTKSHEVDVKETEQGLYCSDIKDTRCAGTKILLREVIEYLRQRSGLVDCSSLHKTSETKSDLQKQHRIHFAEKCVHVNEIIDYLSTKKGLIKNPEQNTKIAISSVLAAITKNPHWEVLLLDTDYNEVIDTETVTYLVSLVSSKSLMCRLRELAYFIYVRAVIFGMAVTALILAYFVYLAYKKNRSAKDKEYYDLISRVTSMVEKQYELSLLDPANIKPYIAISHIYDSLVDPSERASKKNMWNKIVKFIQDHESRIHLETQFINGEETHVWKWIVAKHESVLKNKYNETGPGFANSTMINSTTIKHSSNSTNNYSGMKDPLTQVPEKIEHIQPNGWQGSAFNRKNDKLMHSPTPCLKIRNMFDLEDFENDRSLTAKIHNNIIEKCMLNNIHRAILHIAVDKKSKEGCVYVKCVNNDAAGSVYETLNGTWYNKKLLNVKFLRSDRYLERFPESIGYNKPVELKNH